MVSDVVFQTLAWVVIKTRWLKHAVKKYASTFAKNS